MAFIHRIFSGNKTDSTKQKTFSGELKPSDVNDESSSSSNENPSSRSSTGSMFAGLSVHAYPQEALSSEDLDDGQTEYQSTSEKSKFSFIEDTREDYQRENKIATTPASAFAFISENSPSNHGMGETQSRRRKKHLPRPGFANQSSESSDNLPHQLLECDNDTSITEMQQPSSQDVIEKEENVEILKSPNASEQLRELDIETKHIKQNSKEMEFNVDERIVEIEEEEKGEVVLLNYLDVDSIDDDTDSTPSMQLPSIDDCVSNEDEDNQHIDSFSNDLDLIGSLSNDIHIDQSEKDCVNYEVDLSEEEQFSVDMNIISSKYHKLSGEYMALESSKSVLLENCQSSACQIASLQTKLSNLQEEQKNSISTEDYDLAESLGIEINEVVIAIKITKSYHLFEDEKLSILIKDCSDYGEHCKENISDIRQGWENLLQQQRTLQVKLEKQNERDWTKRKQLWQEQTKNFERSLQHVKLDLNHFKQTENQLVESMHEDTKNLQIKQNELNGEREEIQDEITILEKKLSELKEKKLSYTTEIKSLQNDIDNILSDYQPKRNQIKHECQVLELQEKSYQLKLDKLETEGKELETTKLSSDNETQRLVSNISDLEDELEKIQSFQSKVRTTLPNSSQMIDLPMKIVSETDTEYERLKDQVALFDTHIDEITQEILKLQSNTLSFEKQIKESQSLLEELEKTKLLAVKARQFKEAKRVSEEYKTIASAIEDNKLNLAETKQNIIIKKEIMESEKAKSKEILTEFSKVEYQQDLSKIQSLKESIEFIKSSLTDLHEENWMTNFANMEINISMLQLEELCELHNLPLPGDLDRNKTKKDGEDTNNPDNNEAENDEPPCDIEASVDKEKVIDVDTTEESHLDTDINNIITDLEMKLQEAIDMEDFDTADIINNQIEELKRGS